ncbi:hypothetical protein CCY99_01440 [Helicobacter sp. 16-1353]|uniref:TolC family protein n=1 Tax=Helicobacter sp. 16-1353 TaxID=2004996 RepID=UPI000DCB4768|nr:TolC family protein [Helicobacter sp. 16-1353]RAX54845.1 hypothetical protein CCY99_01440 [Helicobacter sp. 16-1353]
MRKLLIQIVFMQIFILQIMANEIPIKENLMQNTYINLDDNSSQNQNLSKNLTYSEFLELVFENSQDLVMQNALSKSIEAEGKAMNAWDSPYVEVNPSFAKNPSLNRYESQAQVLLMLTPKMPWVSGIIKDSYATKALKNVKITQLQKNIIAIGAKRGYLSYLIYKEQLEIYKEKAQLAKNALEIAEKRFLAERISKAELLRFRSDYASAVAVLKTQSLLVDSSLGNLQILAGREFSKVADLDFYYLGEIDLNLEAENSIYSEVLRLEALDYEKSAKVVSRSRMDALQMGAGYTFGANSIDLKFIIPLPFSSKTSHQQVAILEIQSGSLRQNELKERQIRQSASIYKAQLSEQKELIAIAKQNEEVQKDLFEIMQKGFEAGAVGVFEYLNTKNNYLEARIKTTQEKLNYINLLSMLEESLGREILK